MIPPDCVPVEGETVTEILSGPDARGRCVFYRYRWADYRPGHPDGEGPGPKGQIFNARPEDHPSTRTVDRRRV